MDTVAAVFEIWSVYQRGDIAVAVATRRLRGLVDTLDSDVDDAIRRSASELAEQVAVISERPNVAGVDRRLAEAMNRFLVDVGEEPVAALERRSLLELLAGRRAGTISLDEIRAKARRCWLAGLAPTDDVLAHDTVFFLTQPFTEDLRQDDVAALLDYVATPLGSEDHARDRFYDYLIERFSSDEREAELSGSVKESDVADDDELSLALPTQRRLRRAVRLAPESIWAELAERLCSDETEDVWFLTGLLEELVYDHADAFIERIERLARDCPAARERIAGAHIGGVGATPALERFWSLQEQLQADQYG